MKIPASKAEAVIPAILVAAVFGIVAFAAFSFPRSAAPALASGEIATTTSPATEIWKTASGKNPQFIVFAFDGSRSVPMWEETRAFARQMAAKGKPLHFTYFINAAYFLGSDHRGEYQAPDHARGESGIGFGGSPAEIESRIAEVNAAYAEGNEIGSHTAGHYPGAAWSAAEWSQEFGSFSDILSNVNKYNPEIPAASHFDFPPSEISGFRAPDLSVSPGLSDALSADHFLYDASLAGWRDRWPYKAPAGYWEFPLGSVTLGGRYALDMDFNFYTSQTGGQNLARKGTPLWDRLFGEVSSAYDEYFDQNYAGTRAPIYIANHFSKWNDGLYWEALKSFAEKECGKPEVHCVSYKELAGYLDAMPPENAALAK